MHQTLSTRQLRLVGLLLVVVVAAGGYWLVVRKHNASSPATSVSTPASTTPTAPSTTHPHATAPTTPTRLAAHGLPAEVARALAKHRVVVVSLSAPRAGLDRLASGEAQSGAAAAGAGYVDLDVFRQRQGSPILHSLGVVDTPAVLVVTRHGVYAELRGFVDRKVVEQAVVDARG